MTEDFNTDGMVALLPTTNEWCKQKLAHTTVAYLGDISERSPAEFNDLGKLASSVAMITPPISVKVIDKEIMGEETKVDALILDPSPQLLAIRSFFEMWDVSEWPTYKPHATIGPAYDAVPDFLPIVLTFDRIMVGWGNESLTFWLNKGY